MVSVLLVALLLQGLTANQGLDDLNNPTTRENYIRLNIEKFVARGKRIFPLQPPWLVRLIHDNYNDLERSLVSCNDTISHYHALKGLLN